MNDRSLGSDSPELHRASWLVPVAGPPVEDGAVWIQGNSILSAGRYASLKSDGPAHARVIDHGSAALIPALVNPHTHLELSALRGKISLPQASFASWFEELMPHRQSLSQEALACGFEAGRRELAANGTCLCGDITNGFYLLSDPQAGLTCRHVFLEVLGFDCADVESALAPEIYQAFQMAARSSSSYSLAAHAPYSASAGVIQSAKAWCRRCRQVFSIHAAEHPEEIEFLREGTGFFHHLLQNLGRWVDHWTPPASSPVAYLDRLAVLDAHTLLIHAVHMSDSDWNTVAKQGSSVCFCPRSNRNLNAGRADIGKALRLGITAALGTDSLASNADLNSFAEAVFVLDHYPDLNPESVLTMITLAGARALHQEHLFGTIAPGRRAALLAVSVPETVRPAVLFETLLHQGKEGAFEWVHYPETN